VRHSGHPKRDCRVLLSGNVTRDPELRYTPGAHAVAQFGLAVNRRWRGAAGELQEEPCFVEVVVWGKPAEVVVAHLGKGRAVLVEGRLQLDQWESAGGECRSRLKVVGQRVTFLPGGGGPEDSAEGVGEALPAGGADGR
jgi:single-strand DNA-binding protein